MMIQSILDFPKQFSFEPEIEYAEKLIPYNKFIVCGMGGSALAGELFKVYNPRLDVLIHRDYGLPDLPEKELRESLIIASSYSGNTEETLSAFLQSKEKNFSLAAIAVGGKILELAEKNKIPYIKIPNTDIQPRCALGFSLRAMAKLMGQEKILEETRTLADTLRPNDCEARGKELAETIKDKIPLIYASNKNAIVAYNWKIKFNETGKVPSFHNVIPELNHNEINGFEIPTLSRQFHAIFMKDKNDHPRVIKRMEVTEKLYKEKGLGTTIIEITGESIWRKIFSSLMLADWTSHYMATGYGLDSESVPMVENLKKLLNT